MGRVQRPQINTIRRGEARIGNTHFITYLNFPFSFCGPYVVNLNPSYMQRAYNISVQIQSTNFLYIKCVHRNFLDIIQTLELCNGELLHITVKTVQDTYCHVQKLSSYCNFIEYVNLNNVNNLNDKMRFLTYSVDWK